MQPKRSFVLILVIALIVSSLGVLTASAATVPAERTAQPQDDSPSPWLGVLISDADNGVTIKEVVADSPAEKADLMAGDIITAVDDTAIESAEQLIETIQTYAVGDEIALTVLRDGDEISVMVTLDERPAGSDLALPEIQTRPYRMQGRMNLLGIDLEMTDDGLLVRSIDEDSPLAESELQTGDIITAIDGDIVTDFIPRGLMELLRGDQPITLTVLRDGEEREIELDLSAIVSNVVPFDPSEIISPRTVQPTKLGVYFRTVTADLAAQEELAVDYGALIDEVVEDTPAAEAGLNVGDIVLAVDGDVVDEERTLPDRLYAYEEGDVVTLTVLRDGDEIELEVTLGPRAANMFRGGFGMFSEDFLKNHPFMKDYLDQMPEGGFQFHFGPWDSIPDQDDSGMTDENNTNA